jgi:hypothetical protein
VLEPVLEALVVGGVLLNDCIEEFDMVGVGMGISGWNEWQ